MGRSRWQPPKARRYSGVSRFLQARHLLLGCQAVLQEVQGPARTQHRSTGEAIGKPTAACWPSVLRLKIAAVACRKRTVHAASRKALMFTDADAGELPR